MISAKEDSLVTENLGLVHSCCKRFTGKGIEYDDLYQAGCMGLIKASNGFDRSRGLKFSTYAVPVILGEIKHLFREGGSVKVSRSIKELSMKISRERESYIAEHGNEPTVSELALILGLEPSEVSEALTSSLPVYSLTVDDEGEATQIDIAIEPEESSLLDTLSLEEAVSKLKPRERELIELRYFCHNTQMQTAKKLGISQVQVSRNEKAILLKLRSILTG